MKLYYGSTERIVPGNYIPGSKKNLVRANPDYHQVAYSLTKGGLHSEHVYQFLLCDHKSIFTVNVVADQNTSALGYIYELSPAGFRDEFHNKRIFFKNAPARVLNRTDLGHNHLLAGGNMIYKLKSGSVKDNLATLEKVSRYTGMENLFFTELRKIATQIGPDAQRFRIYS